MTDIIATGDCYLSADIYQTGRGRITGTVKVHGAVTDTPAARKVGLFRRRTLERVAITWSDPATGAYSFSGLPIEEPYFVCGLDHTLAFDGVLHDNIYAEAS